MTNGEPGFNAWAPPPGSWRPPTAARPPAPRRRRPWRIVYWVTFGLLLAAVVGLFAGFIATVGVVRQSAPTMAPTIQTGALVIYERGASGIVRGDVVVVQVPTIGMLASRVIGLPGDRVTCCDSAGRIAVNGTVLTEDYLPPGVAPSRVPFAVTVNPGQVWVMGDNRTISLDPRGWGPPLAMSDIVGRVIEVSRAGGYTQLRTPATFTANGLAPVDRRVPLPFVLLGLALFGMVAAIVQGAAGIIAWAARRRRRLRQQPMAW